MKVQKKENNRGIPKSGTRRTLPARYRQRSYMRSAALDNIADADVHLSSEGEEKIHNGCQT